MGLWLKRYAALGTVIAGLLMLFLPSLCLSEGQANKGFVARRKIAVLPFFAMRPETVGESMVKGLYGEFFFRAGELPPRAGSEVTSIFYHELIRLGRCEVIPLDKAAAVVEGVAASDVRRDPLGTAVHMGAELGVYAVVIGGVYRFEERRGSALGVERPASVAIDAHLVRVEDGEVMWSGRFDETQQSLSENLLKAPTFIKGGGRWVRVEKLTAIGVESVLSSFPSLTL